jgi:multiple sugar transport system permease protein
MLKKLRKSQPYLLMAPTMVWLLAFIVYPLIFAIVMALKQFRLKKGLTFWDMPFVGLYNFQKAIGDENFLQALWITVLVMIVAVTIEFLLGLGVAMLLNRKNVRGHFFYMTLLLTPMMMPIIAGGLLWRMLLDVRWGAVNAVVEFLSLPAIDFLGDIHWSLPSVMLVDVWQWTPFVVLILLSGLRAIPEELHEAAVVDGAGRFQAFRNVTWPLLAWPVMIVLLIRSMDAFKIFDVVYGLTFGGPGNSTTTVSFFIYKQGFSQFNLGYAAALSWIVFIIVYLTCVLIIRFLKPAEE